jgi:hypothetical protein
MTTQSARAGLLGLILCTLPMGAAWSGTVDAASAMNATMTESTVELSAILSTLNRKIHNGESFGFGTRSWTGSADANAFSWRLEGVYDGKNVLATSTGVYHAATGMSAPTITWTTHVDFGDDEVTSAGTNVLSVDEVPASDDAAEGAVRRGWSWRNVWKKARQATAWVAKNWTEITTIANQVLTVVALPNPITVAVEAVSSAGKIAVHRALPVTTVASDGNITVALVEEDIDIGFIDFGARQRFTDRNNPIEVAGMSGGLSALLMVDATYFDRLAVADLSASYDTTAGAEGLLRVREFGGSGSLGQLPEPGSAALVAAALALLGVVGRSRARAAPHQA